MCTAVSASSCSSSYTASASSTPSASTTSYSANYTMPAPSAPSETMGSIAHSGSLNLLA